MRGGEEVTFLVAFLEQTLFPTTSRKFASAAPSLVRVHRGGHGDLDDDMFAFEGIVVVVDSVAVSTARLKLEIMSASSLLLFEEGSDDAGR